MDPMAEDLMLPNPNISQNRVPDHQELETLRSIATSQSSLANNIQVQIMEAQAAYEGAMQRYRAQKLVLDSLLSEVHAAKRFLSSLEAQKKILDDDLHDIRGLVHPIRRFPSELLNLIFGMTVTPVPRKSNIKIHREYLRETYKLMRVCRYWRDVALQCPVLWAAIPVSLNDDVSEIDSFWKRSVQRVKRAPASICISDLVLDPAVYTIWRQRKQHCQDALNACDLTQIPVISKLRLQAAGGESVTFPLSLMTRYPVGSLECLEILGRWDDGTETLDWWSWTLFLQRFPGLTCLDVQGVQDFRLDEEVRFTTLTQLRLHDQQFCSVADLLLAFPSLEHLDVGVMYDSESMNPSPSFPCSLPNLKFLSLNGNGYDDFSLCNITDACATFLSSCPQLTSVELKMAEFSILPLVPVADGLLHLTLEGGETYISPFIHWEEEGLSAPPFPKLKTLTIFYPTPDDSYEAPAFRYFDELVRKRCLSPSDPASLLVPPLVPLDLLIIKQNPMIPSTWIQSVHYQTATARVIGKDSQYSVMKLSWNLREEDVLTLKPALQKINEFWSLAETRLKFGSSIENGADDRTEPC